MNTRRCLAMLALSTVCGARGHAALLTNFANSFSQYQAQIHYASDFNRDLLVDGVDFMTWQRGVGRTNETNNSQGDANADHSVTTLDVGLWRNQFATVPAGLPESVCFKLYFDPAGIIEGQVTVVVDAPQTGASRFTLGTGNGLIAVDPRFDFDVVESIKLQNGRERFEAQVHFTLKPTAVLPTESVTLFGYQVHDNLPLQSVAAVNNGFLFQGNDFITIRNEDLTITTFTEAQLQDVPLQLDVPLVLDVNTTTGQVRFRNPTGGEFAITYYEILSASGSLNPSAWISLDDGEGGDPPGVGWDEAGGAGPQGLAESNVTGSRTFLPNETLGLGAAFNPTGVRDLRFNFARSNGAFIEGVVVYSATAPVTAVPEPAGSLLAAAAAAALVAGGRRPTLRRRG
jgi:hypothetical protein